MTDESKEDESSFKFFNVTSEKTWESALNFYTDLTASRKWKRKQSLIYLINHLNHTDVKQHFRAGQSLWLFFITAKSTHGIEKNDPVIKVDCDCDDFSVQYWIGWKGSPLESVQCRQHTVMEVLVPMMIRIWEDTHDELYPGTALSSPIQSYDIPLSYRFWCVVQNLFSSVNNKRFCQ